MLVCRQFFDIIAAQRQVSPYGRPAVFIKRDDFKQTVFRNGSAACGYKLLIGEQAEADIFDFSVIADTKQLVCLQRFFKADLNLLPFIDEGSRRFSHGYILSGVNEFDGMDFTAQHHSIACLDLFDFIFSEVEFLAFCKAGFIGRNRIDQLALAVSESSVRRYHIFGGTDFINGIRQSLCFINRLIDNGKLLPVFICPAAYRNAGEYLARLFNADRAFLRHIGLFNFYHCYPAFLRRIFFRDIKIDGCGIKDISIRTLYLNDRVSLTVWQLFRRYERAVSVGIESVNGCRGRIGKLHRYEIAGRIVNLESCARIGNGLARFCVHLDYLDIAFKIAVVNQIAVGLGVLCDEHIKIIHQLPAFPAGYLMDGICAVRHILCLCKAVLIADERITLGFLCVRKRACGFEIHFKNCAFFGRFNLRLAIVRMFDNGDIALDDLFRYIICGLVMLNGIKLRLCADLMDGRIEQIALTRLQFLDCPVRTADIFFCGKLTVFIGIVFINELFALENPVFCSRKRGVSLSRSRLSVALGHGNGKLLQDIREIAGSDLVPLDGCALIFGNDITDCCIHFLNGVRRSAADQHIFKGRHTVFIRNRILVHGNAGERSAVKVEGHALIKVILRGFDNLNIATLQCVVEVDGRNLSRNYGYSAGLLRLVAVIFLLGYGIYSGH